MPVSILVATPHEAFGDLLKLSLEENKQYQVELLHSGQEVRARASQSNYQLAILDAALLDEPFVPLCFNLLDRQKGIRLVIVPPENNPNHPALGGLMPHGYLNRPFYLPDLLETVSSLLQQRDAESRSSSASLSYTSPPWLQETITLQAYLEKELKQTLALAGFVGLIGSQRGIGDLRAKAGRLGEAASQELAGIVFRYWNRDEKTDLMRFMRLSADKADYLIYATQVSGDLVLIMVFNSDAPLSQIRPQTKSVAQNLATVPPEGYQNSPLPEKAADQNEAHPGADNHPSDGKAQIQEPDTQPLNEKTFSSHKRAASIFPWDARSEQGPGELLPSEASEREPFEDEDDGTLINLSTLLGSVPSPDPKLDQPPETLSGGWELAAEAPEEPHAPLQLADSVPHPAVPADQNSADSSGNTLILDEPRRENSLLEDTRPRIISAISSINKLEPVSPAMSLLNYTCVLVPRLPHHYLTGELADQLSSWVQQLCLAFGWRLEGIAVRPEYLQWTIQVTPSISPGNLVRVVRQRTSQQIFSRFQQLQAENPSGDFWAAGYLIVSGSQPPSAQLLRDYIALTRKRQGISK